MIVLFWSKGENQISKWLIISFFIFFVSSMLAIGMVGNSISKNKTVDVYVKVKPGMTTDNIAHLLYDKGVTKSVTAFNLFAKMNNLDGKLRAGSYHFSSNMTYSKIIDILSRGNIVNYSFTVPEGYNVNEIAKSLEDKGIADAKKIKELAKELKPYDYMQNNNFDNKYIAEGFLFPDTYQIAEESNEKDIVLMMINEFDKRFDDKMKVRAHEMGLSIREVVILASLVEKEARIDEDRPIIAQVFINRLKQEMPLQSCATIQYILGYAKPELSIQDTKIESPYNTYLHQGLPPGPIANPGLASLKAVLYSQPTNYLYFVADSEGRHHFSETYEGHLRNIQQVN